MSRFPAGPIRARFPHGLTGRSRRLRPRLSLLSVLTPALLLPLPAAAQAAPDVIVVTGTRTPTRADQALAHTTVIDRTRIEEATGRTLAELLSREPGLQFSSNGGAGKASSVSMRGLEARHTLLLIDGVRYGSATLGTAPWENIPLESIERIEIVRGPLSSLYGSDAVGGVVQVFTRGGTQGLALNGAVTLGSHSTRKLAGGLRFGQGAFDGSVQLAQDRTDGVSATNPRVPFGSFNADDDGFEQRSASARLGWRLAQGWRLAAHAQVADGETRLDDGPGADARAGLRSEVLGLQLTGTVRQGWTTALRLSRSADDYETIASASAFSTLGTIGTVQRQVGWENSLATPLGTAWVLVERLQQKVSRPGKPFAVSDRSISALALGLNGRAGRHGWQGSVRHDRNSQFGQQTTGALSYGFDATAQLRLGASLGTSFNAPSFNQLYFPDFGNPNLQPEEGVLRELSVRWADGGHEVRVAFFSTDIRSYITPGANPTNVDADIEGISLSLATRLGGWTLSASGDLIDPRNSNPRNANFGKRLPRRAPDVFRVAAERQIGAVSFGGAIYSAGDRFDDAGNSIALAGHTTTDLHARWQLARDWQLGVKLNNIAGRQYENVLGYNQPGREAFVTLRYSSR